MRARIAQFTCFAIAAACLTAPATLQAGVFEVSAGFSYSRSNYSDRNFSWSRRYGLSLGYHLSDISQIEFSFQDVMDRTKIDGFEDTTFNDKIYSLNWVQSLVPRGSPIVPYVKAGIGQLNREATGTYSFGIAPPAILDSLTGILGVGIKVNLTKGFGLRVEATTYLTGGRLSTWSDNFAINSGFSFYF
jgi:hypothetical protein